MSQCEPGKLLLRTSRNRFLEPEGTLACWYEDKKICHVVKNTLPLECLFSEYIFFLVCSDIRFYTFFKEKDIV